jgi:3',5'-cyclic-nucleotide phosphodiesterase
MLAISLLPFILITIHTKSVSVQPISPSFYVIPLGTTGGLEENNLSAYLLTSVNDNTPNSAYVSLDDGTIRHGVE